MIQRSILILSLIFLSRIAFANGSGNGHIGEYDSNRYNCPGSGDEVEHKADEEQSQGNQVPRAGGSGKPKNGLSSAHGCAEECQELEFDCASHHLKVKGQVKVVDGEDWLGCAPNSGSTSKPGFENLITTHRCGNPGNPPGLLPPDEVAVDSDPPQCPGGCVMHRMPKGAETKGCFGMQPKLFDFFYDNCGNCHFKVTREGNAPVGVGGSADRKTPVGGGNPPKGSPQPSKPVEGESMSSDVPAAPATPAAPTTR